MSLTETILPNPGLGNWHHAAYREKILFCVGERADARRVAVELFGSPISGRDLAGLAGSPGEAEVEVGVCRGNLTVEISDPGHRIYRGVVRISHAGGGLVLTVEALHIHSPSMQGRGLGLSIFARQLQTARRLGIKRIETKAGRRGNENGYYSWPRYGFDGPLPRWLISRLPPPLLFAQSILDIMDSPMGRQWWLLYGGTVDVVFDVRRGSRSSRTFDRYIHATK